MPSVSGSTLSIPKSNIAPAEFERSESSATQISDGNHSVTLKDEGIPSPKADDAPEESPPCPTHEISDEVNSITFKDEENSESPIVPAKSALSHIHKSEFDDEIPSIPKADELPRPSSKSNIVRVEFAPSETRPPELCVEVHSTSKVDDLPRPSSNSNINPSKCVPSEAHTPEMCDKVSSTSTTEELPKSNAAPEPAPCGTSTPKFNRAPFSFKEKKMPSFSSDSTERKRQTSIYASLQFPTSQKLHTNYCPICLEHVRVSDSYILTGKACCHRFCKMCLRTHLTSKIMEGQEHNPCPMVGEDECENFANDQDVTDLCSAEIRTIFQRLQLRQRQANKAMRACPSCGHKQMGNPKISAMVCYNCDTHFCFYHADDHPGESCLVYAQKMSLKVKMEQVDRKTKKCPDCQTPTHRSGDCNYITCNRCQVDWCWLCGTTLVGTDYQSRHYEWWNVFGCPGALFEEDFIGARSVHCAVSVFAVVTGVPIYVSSFAMVCVLACFCSPCLAVSTRCSCIQKGRNRDCSSCQSLLSNMASASCYQAGYLTFLISMLVSLAFSALLAILVFVSFPIWLALGALCKAKKLSWKQIRRFIFLPVSVVRHFFGNIYIF